MNYQRLKSKLIIVFEVCFFIANEQPHEDARLRGGSLIEPCAIVPGAEKISNQCNICIAFERTRDTD